MAREKKDAAWSLSSPMRVSRALSGRQPSDCVSHLRIAGQGMAHVVHEFEDAAATGEFGAGQREFKSAHGACRGWIGDHRPVRTESLERSGLAGNPKGRLFFKWARF
jgi:hypothetical protein